MLYSRITQPKMEVAFQYILPSYTKDVDVSSFYNMLCFIQYDTLITDGLPPRDWNVRI